jgi:hypothetical protein
VVAAAEAVRLLLVELPVARAAGECLSTDIRTRPKTRPSQRKLKGKCAGIRRTLPLNAVSAGGSGDGSARKTAMALPLTLDAILYDDFVQLRAARRAEDERIRRYISSLGDTDLAGTIRYRTVSKPTNIEQPLAPALDHFFNHQTHHRGQTHGRTGAPSGGPWAKVASRRSSSRPMNATSSSNLARGQIRRQAKQLG